TVHRLSQNSFTTVESTHAIGKKKYIKNVFFFSDTLPGHHKKEKSEDWEILFNGENTDKWRGANTDKLIQNRVLANAAMSYKIIKGLVLRISGGIESNSIL
nr:hypothetical protein [Bacteroidota bacterium]